MAGLYLHIPFCRQACRYCDFYFTVSLRYMNDVVNAMIQELKLRSPDYRPYHFKSIYFGGGTPSVLDHHALVKLFETIYKYYHIEDEVEFTFETNPDDVNKEYLDQLKKIGVNRISLGIQSFREEDLRLMRRSHDALQAKASLDLIFNSGFVNVNADLIYGVPGMTTEDFEVNLMTMFDFPVPHLSAYHLTYEPGTVIDLWRQKKKITPVEEEQSLEQFKRLKMLSKVHSFEHYEISNFAKPGYRSIHNTNYWNFVPYIGIGPSAHSFHNNIRRWNIANNKRYIQALQHNEDGWYEEERLTRKDLYNEFILLSLRTAWGINLKELQKRFGDEYFQYTIEKASMQIDSGNLISENDAFRLTEKGLFISDHVVGEFFIVDD